MSMNITKPHEETFVAECAKKPHYASKQLGDRLYLPHGRGARRVAVVERPCPRDGGESRRWLREETPTTEDEETEIVLGPYSTGSIGIYGCTTAEYHSSMRPEPNDLGTSVRGQVGP